MNFTTELSPRLTVNSVQSQNIARYEFPSKKVVPINWQKLASVDLHELNNGNCGAELLQEHLNHIAFCQAEEEIHVQNAAGQRNILKMFRLAQLIVQYLFISQDYMENQMKQTKLEHQMMLEKYNEMKERLKTQTDEAKKLKKSNCNMIEINTYMNSLLSSIGALNHYRCPLCPKAFRSQEFLLSHLYRKHPLKAASINTAECFVSSGQAEASKSNMDGNRAGLGHRIYHDYRLSFHEKEKLTQINQNNALSEHQSPSHTKSHNFFVDGNGSNMIENPVSIANPRHSKEHLFDRINKNNDIDQYELHKMQEHFTIINNTVTQLSQDLESQKKRMEIEMENRKREQDISSDEKLKMKEEYENVISKLNEKLGFLEQKDKENSDEDKRKVIDLIEKQQIEINILKEELRQKTKSNELVLGEGNTRSFEKELQIVKRDLETTKKQHKKDLEKLKKSLQAEYETALKKEKEEHARQVDILKKINEEIREKVMMTPEDQKREMKMPVPPRNTKPTRRWTEIVKDRVDPTQLRRDEGKKLNVYSPHREAEISKIYSEDTDTETQERHRPIETKDETPNKYMKSKQFLEDTCVVRQTMYATQNDSSSEETTITNHNETQKGKIRLKELVDKNPGLWNQMRQVVEEELDRKLTIFNISEWETGITKEDFKSYIFEMIKSRKILRDKYNDFSLLRKSIENRVENKLEFEKNKKSSPKCDSYQPGGGSPVWKLKGSLQKLTTKLKRKTKKFQRSFAAKSANEEQTFAPTTNESSDDEETASELNSSSSSEEAFHENGQQAEIQSNAITWRKTPVKNRDCDLPKGIYQEEISSQEFDTSAEDEYEHETRVDIHTPAVDTTKETTAEDSSPKVVPFYPRRQSFFENKTYDKIIEEEWDSKSESSAIQNEHGIVPTNTWEGDGGIASYGSKPSTSFVPTINTESTQATEFDHQGIKLKKPTGQLVTELSKKIESQLRKRPEHRPAGAIDLRGDELSEEDQEIPEIKHLEFFSSESE